MSVHEREKQHNRKRTEMWLLHKNIVIAIFPLIFSTVAVIVCCVRHSELENQPLTFTKQYWMENISIFFLAVSWKFDWNVFHCAALLNGM